MGLAIMMSMDVFSLSRRRMNLGRLPALAVTLGCAVWMAACGAEFDLDKADKILAAETQGRFFRLQVLIIIIPSNKNL